MKKLLFIVKPEFVLNYETELIYLKRNKITFSNGRFKTSPVLSINTYASLNHYADLEIDDYLSILSHSQLKRLIAIFTKIESFGHDVAVGSKEYKEGMQLSKEAESIIALLSSKENEQLENQVLLQKIKEISFDLNKKEIVEFCEHLNRKMFDYEVIQFVHESLEDFGKERFEDFYDIYDDHFSNVLKEFFDYKNWAEKIISEGEGYFKTSTGKVIKYESNWYK